MDNLKVEYVCITQLKPNNYNPKRITAKEENDLEKSIVEFGIVDPLIVNKAEKRKGIIIGGHQRFKIYKKLGYKKVPIVYIDIPDLKREQELCLRLSKNTGEFDFGLLAAFSEELLKDVGFENEELMEMFGLNSVEGVEVDVERLDVITVEAPEAPRLKERAAFYCSNMKEYKRIIEYFKKERSELDKDKLLEMI